MSNADQPDNDTLEVRHCLNCGRPLVRKDGVWVCRSCNPEEFDRADFFISEGADDQYIFIECPGATLYKPGTTEVEAGVRWLDDDSADSPYEIVKHPVYAPNHTKRRRIKPEALGKIRRCQACQDYTVRMRRKEGPDFFIPSPKYPGRTRLKSVHHTTRAPQ